MTAGPAVNTDTRVIAAGLAAKVAVGARQDDAPAAIRELCSRFQDMIGRMVHHGSPGWDSAGVPARPRAWGHGERRQRHWKKRNRASERKQKGEKEEGNVERGEKERSSRPPAPAAGEEEGTNPLTLFFPPPFRFWRGNCGAEVGCFPTSLASQQVGNPGKGG